MEENYYCISRRYICHHCQTAATKTKQQVEDLAKEHGLVAEVGDIDDECYTFMAWNKDVLPLYPYDRGNAFPAYLSWRAGVDKLVLKHMRSLYDGGFRPKAYSKLLLEMIPVECPSGIVPKKKKDISSDVPPSCTQVTEAVL